MSDETEPDSAEPGLAAEADAALADEPIAEGNGALAEEAASEALDVEPGLADDGGDAMGAEEEGAGAAFDIGSMEDAVQAAAGGRTSAFMGVPIEVLICVGKARPLVSDLVKLRRDSVISLDSRIDDPVEIYIGDRLIARGELQEMEDQEGQLGVRLTEVADLSNAV